MRQLSNQEKALLFCELSRLEQSGIPRLQALSLIGEDSSELASRANETQRLCKMNYSFPVSAYKAGLINDSEKPLIELADETAQYEKVFHHLESLYQDRSSRQKKLKSQLLLPAIVFILALFIAPIPALFNNVITPFEYLISILWTLLKIAALLYLLFKIPGWITQNKLGQAIRTVYFQFLLSIPVFSRLYIQHIMLEYFRQLSISLSAGLPLLKSLKLSENCVANESIRNTLAQLPQCIEQGDTFSDAIKKTLGNSGLIEPSLEQAIVAGEFSGSLDDSIKQMINFLDIFYQQTLEAFFQWLPRIVYFLVLIIMAHGLLQ